MTPQAFIIPARADPDAIERARPTGIAPGDRCRSELLYQKPDAERAPDEPRIWKSKHAALEPVAVAVPEPRPELTWWENVIEGITHSYRDRTLWVKDDDRPWQVEDCHGDIIASGTGGCGHTATTLNELADAVADAIADALWAEARRLTAVTEELVTVPAAAVAAVARIRRGE